MRYDLSVIIPFFNSSRFIYSSIKNAIDITKNLNAQIIYVDDKSKDDSYRKLKKKANNKNDILILRSKKNLGPGNARNIGLKKAQGKKIIFLDIEDRLVVSNLREMLEIYRKKSLNLINYNHIVLNKNIKKKVFVPQLISSSNRRNLIDFLIKKTEKSVIYTMFEKKFISRNKIFFNNGYHEDIFFIYRCLFYNKKKIKFFKKVVYKKYNYSFSITNTFSLNHLKGMFLAWKNIYFFLKKKLSVNEYRKFSSYIQYRLRGEFVNEFNKILSLSKNHNDKKRNLKFLILNYKKIIDLKFNIKTRKDKIADLLLNKSILLN